MIEHRPGATASVPEEPVAQTPIPAEVEALVERSHRLGADPRTTNFGGGNTSAKHVAVDPVTGIETEVLSVKGSGGDLATLSVDGLSHLDLGRLRALQERYRGADHEDEMVDLLPLCAFGPPSAVPSIDTAMHGLLPASHVDHLHPDSVIALAAAADGERLTAECFGHEVAWVPWRRPGFELGVQLARLQASRPALRGVVLGGHGLTAWGATSDEAEATSLELIERAAAFIERTGRAEPFGSVRPGYTALADDARRDRAAALAPFVRGLASTHKRVVGAFDDSPVVLDFLSRTECPRLVSLGTSCPDHFLRTKVRPLLLDLPADAALDEQVARLRVLHAEYRAEYEAYYRRHADGDSPAMRGADPAVVLVPGVGMFTFGADARTARVAGEFYVNAINVMRGAEAVSTYAPIDEAEKFRIEYWSLEERKLALLPRPRALAGQIAYVTGGGSGIGRAIALRLAAEGAAVAVADRDLAAAEKVANEIGGRDRAVAVHVDVADEAAIVESLAQTMLVFGGIDIVVNNAGLSISKPLLETDAEDWDVQHRVMARGSFLVSREAARVLIAQATGGSIVYVVSKNAIVAGPDNIAYAAAKADQAHQVRLLAAELGDHGVRVNGVNPDGVVQGSGIFSNGWGAARAEVYGVEESELGAFYAQRTLLKEEVLPEHVANAVFALVGDELRHTTGTLVPVDGGVPVAFVR
ncbi:MAG TPA: bifunctional rhamnulose-1-phosphate aldolase/short-chain dehydrogenase [Acidimicrobiales bacterium]|nr:bifunctional rhamnulose-1-phosphate aldolase/short-chain dehydrogenase [Acidimicrobiales bacterium]